MRGTESTGLPRSGDAAWVHNGEIAIVKPKAARCSGLAEIRKRRLMQNNRSLEAKRDARASEFKELQRHIALYRSHTASKR